jgi:hypothetical protein
MFGGLDMCLIRFIPFTVEFNHAGNHVKNNPSAGWQIENADNFYRQSQIFKALAADFLVARIRKDKAGIREEYLGECHFIKLRGKVWVED